MKNIKKVFILALACVSMFALASCGDKPGSNTPTDPKGVFDNENDPLVFSTQELDKVFNPFFSTSATDSNVVGMTQIGMIGNDAVGNPTFGDNESVVTKDLEIKTVGTVKDVDMFTTYYFVLKNNVKFSDGTRLSIKDVLFNYYVYLDPVYDGSSTIYSTDIVGLKEYRTGEADEKEQNSFQERFEIAAANRIQNLVNAANEILDDCSKNGIYLNFELNGADDFADLLNQYIVDNGSDFATISKDYAKAKELFYEELQNDYSNSLDQFAEMKFYDEKGKEYKDLFTTDVEVFLYNEGLISWNKKDGVMNYALGDAETTRQLTKEDAIKIVYENKIPNDVTEVLLYWGTSQTLLTYAVNDEMQKYAEESSSSRQFKNISGIKFANKEDDVTVNGVVYPKAQYNDNNYNDLKDGFYEVLSITIKNIDPKAIWNFSIGVAPMNYYSNAEQIALFDFEEHFGVEYMSQTFMNEVVKSSDKIGVPMGAGPYAASKSDGGITNIQAGDFYDKGIVYFERNPYYLMGAPKIKKVRFKVCASSQMTNQLYSKEIDYVEPNCKPETIAELDTKKSDGISYKPITTQGYGYIGINAGKVPSINVRRVIMYAINVNEIVGYYKNRAQVIYRSMSRNSWAYPKNATAYYPYIDGQIPEDLSVVDPAYAEFVTSKGYTAGQVLSKADQKEFLTGLIEEAGYKLDSNGIYVSTDASKHALKYTFTIAGETDDHPAYLAMFKAGKYLNEIGFNVNVTTDANALRKLSNGDLTVWAAAWGSTIDPDMYQVYHKDSKATSVLNWGYKQIKQNTNNKYDTELAIIEELSDMIDAAREINDVDQRKVIYFDALDKVMELAVELPTYQREDLFAYSSYKIDVATLNQQPTALKGLTSEMHNISLNLEK